MGTGTGSVRALAASMGKDEVLRQELGCLHDIPLYKSFVAGWPQVEAFQARHDDLLIATYPKSGKWLQGRWGGEGWGTAG